jgi:hypothetical protein
LFSLGPVSVCSKNTFCTALLEPAISSFDSDNITRWATFAYRGGPFSHPSGSSAGPESALRSFFLSYIKSFFVLVFSVFLAINWRNHSDFRDTPSNRFELSHGDGWKGIGRAALACGIGVGPCPRDYPLAGIG